MKKPILILTLLLPVCFLFGQSTVNQVGNNNFVDVHQEGQNNLSAVTTAGSFNAFSFVDQEGDGVNESYVNQGLSDGNRVDVDQTNGFDLPLDRNSSIIDQTGNWNSATVEQVHFEGPAGIFGSEINAYVNQTGNWNSAEVHQEGRWLQGTVVQDGSGSAAKQFQGKSQYAPGKAAHFSEATIVQTSNVDFFSRAEQHQAGNQNSALIDQNSGFLSKAVQIQINDQDWIPGPGTRVNQAYINQQGDYNRAHQIQTYAVDGAAPNVANTFQDGYGNFTYEVQVGGDGDSYVYQNGDGNVANVYQKVNVGADDPTSILAVPPWGL
jgi:hypothetical protein